MNSARHGSDWLASAVGLMLALVMAPAWAGANRPGALAEARAQAKALADSQQNVVQLSNELQGLEARASQSQQMLGRQDRQIARLKAALEQAARPAAARSH
ncbi:hypothetical protein [Frateuria aurantia]|uniref:Uncharacterized protein n=1 Tax=Frateuria aurantia (strain ATCC 33424 / DSM 6220 / KCTC 2777 / LMG 1558 / NBRC 3245 / NCIMB 13370) TaxID=767434 RepID=H8L1M1_FRAAD|nr:hypothetical protein [Frateuria aurantia]AFC85381.1 hypothetical protein Fraau_0912 [Frateuria aurantia DSM 6220]